MPRSTPTQHKTVNTQVIDKLYAVTFRKSAVSHLIDFWESAAERFGQDRAEAQACMDQPDFGWSTALKLILLGKQPAMLKKPECRWLRKAAAFMAARYQVTDGDPDLQAVSEAYRLNENADIRPVLQAALLTCGATAESVGTALGLEALTVEAYDALFFNVLDRKDDLAYLRNAVRAGLTRRGWIYMVENVDAGHEALLHAGLNGTLRDVLYLAGCGRAQDQADESPAGGMLQTIVTAGSAWLAANRDLGSALPPLVRQAIDIARKTDPGADPDTANRSAGVLSDFIYAQLDLDVRAIKAGIEAGIKAAPGKPAEEPAARVPMTGLLEVTYQEVTLNMGHLKTKANA